MNVLPSTNIPVEPWLIPVNSTLANSRSLKGRMLFPSAQIYYSTQTWITMLAFATLIGDICWPDYNRSGVSLFSKLPARGNPLATNDPKYIFSEICSFIQVNWLHVLFTAGAVLQFIFSSVKSHESKKTRMMWELYLQVSIKAHPVKTAVTVKAVYLKDKENVVAK